MGELARLSGVSVRTLQHCDAIGLVTRAVGERRATGCSRARGAGPKASPFYRELDFGLEEIATMLADPHSSVGDHLRCQNRLLERRRTRTEDLLSVIEKVRDANRVGISLTPEEQFEVFGTDGPGEFAAQAEQRRVHTETWQHPKSAPAVHQERLGGGQL